MKRLVSIILCLTLMLAPCTMIAEDSVVSSWAEEDVKRAETMNWAYFGVDNYAENITRGEFCRIVTGALKSCGLDVLFFSMDTPFTDIGEGNYEIKYLYCLNVIEGKSETLFCPDDYLTREEAAVIFVRVIDAFRRWNVADIKAYEEADFVYRDYTEISSWAKGAARTVRDLGIMQGTGTYFEPKKQLTYEEAIAMLIRLYYLRWQSSISSGTFADKLNTLMPKDKNYMFSPLSIKMALGLTANGGDADIEEILIDNLMDESSVAYYNIKANDYIKKYSDNDVLSLDIANSIWVNKDVTQSDFTDEFKNAAEKFYRAEVGRVNKADAVKTINNWVNDKTKGKINRILQEDNNDFSAAIINAVYFKGEWEKAFYETHTERDIFTDGNGNKMETDFMNQTGSFNYYADTEIQMVELPYKCDEDSDVSMFIILCKDDIKLEDKLLYVENGYMRSESVMLSIPKFEMEYADSLKEELIKLGAEEVFEGGFNNILENEELLIDDVLHKTYIKINEKETEASAVTAVIAKATSAKPTEPVVFKADRPFYFVIRDNVMDEVLFMGRYAYIE